MTIRTDPRPDVLRNKFEVDVAAYWDNKREDSINLLPAEVDHLYHHHFGVGGFDPEVLTAPPEVREERVLAELHRLESQQVEVILDAMGVVSPAGRVLVGGSGRGAESFMIGDRFGCNVDGANISEYQIEFSRHLAAERKCDDRVRFHFQNMCATTFPDQSFERIVTNETTMYVDLFEVFGEFARLLVPGGRYVAITWCFNDIVAPRSEDVAEIAEIDRFYACHIHPMSTYFAALAANGLVPRQVVDLTAEAIPYWELRCHSEHRNGIEQAFLSTYEKSQLTFLLIAADRWLGEGSGSGHIPVDSWL